MNSDSRITSAQSKSKQGPATGETDNLGNSNHTLSRRRDEQKSEGVRPTKESERRNDATRDSEASVNGSSDVIEEEDVTKETDLRSPSSAAGKASYDFSAFLPDTISQFLKKPVSPSTTHGSISTIRPVEHTRNKKQASHTLTRKTTSTASINISHNRNRFLHSSSQRSPAGPAGSPSALPSQINSMALALNTIKTTARIREDLLEQMTTESSSPHGTTFGQFDSSSTKTGKSTIVLPVHSTPDTVPAPLLAGTTSKVVPNTALGSHRAPLFASDTSKPSANFWDIVKDKARKETPLSASSLPMPPLPPRNDIHFSFKPSQRPIFSFSKPSSPPIPHSSIISPPYSDTTQETLLFTPPSSTLPNLVKDPCNHKSDDEYTSADAEGESVSGYDSLFEFVESVADTPPTQPIGTNSAASESSKRPPHKSVYDLFTPPLTRHSSEIPHQFVENEPPPQRAPRPRLFMFYVEVPPLPQGVNKSEYRPFKRIKRTHDDVEYSPEGASTNAWGWERRDYKRAKYPRRRASPRPARSPSVLSLATTASSHVLRGRQKKQPKLNLSQPPAPSTMEASQRISVTEGRITTITPVSTTHYSSSQPRPPMPSFQSPSLVELGTQNPRIRDAEHLPPVVTYFNTRHHRLDFKEDLTGWILLGAQILTTCLGPGRLSCVKDLKLDDSSEIDEGNYSVGGSVYWEGCSGGGEESSMSQFQKRRSKNAPRSELDVRKPQPSVGTLKIPSEESTATRSLGISVPEVQNTKGLKEKTSVVASPPKPKRDVEKGRPAETSEMPESQSQREPRSPAAVEQEPESRPYLSEKARGKLKAIDTDFAETDFHGDLPSGTALSPTTAQGLIDVDAFSPTINSPTWPRSMEPYITFGASPVKLGEGSNHHHDGYAPKLPYALYDTNQFLSSRARMDDIFLPPHDVGPSIFNDGINTMEGLDAYHEPYDALMNAEKEVQPTTINPTLLGGNTFDHATDEMGLTVGVTSLMDDADGTEIENHKMLDVTKHSQQLSGIKAGYEPILGSPIASAERSSSSSWNESPRLSQPPSTSLRSRSISVTPLGRTSSPEFSDSNVPSQLRLSSLTKESRAVIPVRIAASASHQDDGVSSEREEEEVQRGLEFLDAFSASDEDFIPVSDLENESEGAYSVRPVNPRPRRRPSASPPPELVPAGPLPAVTKKFRRGQKWKCGPIRSCCHYCRTSSNKLKMICPCGSRYCNRCLALRFPDVEFRLKWDGYDCPNCKNRCTCDVCTRKRGEVYVPLRHNKESLSRTTSIITRPQRAPQSTVQLSPLTRLTALPSPEAIENVERFSFWGSIYDMSGNKIAVGFADEDNEVVVANAVEGYTRPKIDDPASEDELPANRIFVGAYQPSWGLGNSPIIRDLKGRRGRRRPNDADVDDTELRWYIGKESLLYRSVVVRSKDLPTNPFSDMSSLSSLSDDSDVEVDGITSLPTVDKTFTTKDQDINIKNIDSDAIQARDTVHILQKIARDMCGMMSNVEQSLMSN